MPFLSASAALHHKLCKRLETVTRPKPHPTFLGAASSLIQHIEQSTMKLTSLNCLLAGASLSLAASVPIAERATNEGDLVVQLSTGDSQLKECEKTTVMWSNGLTGRNISTSVTGE